MLSSCHVSSAYLRKKYNEIFGKKEDPVQNTMVTKEGKIVIDPAALLHLKEHQCEGDIKVAELSPKSSAQDWYEKSRAFGDSSGDNGKTD